MKHKLGLKAAAIYGQLIDQFSPAYMRPDFEKLFEKFLDAYDGGNTPDKTQTVPEDDEQRDIPKAGEIYRDTLNYRLKILAVLDDANGHIVLAQNCSDFLKSSIRLMTLTDFEKLALRKED